MVPRQILSEVKMSLKANEWYLKELAFLARDYQAAMKVDYKLELFNIASSKSYSINQLLQLLENSLGKKALIEKTSETNFGLQRP